MWKTVTLGASCKMYQPKTISAKEMVADGEYVVFGANGIIGKYNQYNHAEPQLLVTCRGATCGAVNVSQPFSWINGNAMVIQPDLNNISLKYMEYLFRGGIDLTKAITGAAQPQITRQSLEPIEFSYPPLAEQKRIVAKLDAAFAEIDAATELLQSKSAEVKKLKAAILDKNLNEILAQKPKVKLSAACERVSVGHVGITSKYYCDDGVPFIRTQNVSKNGFDDSELKFITQEFHQSLKKSQLKAGDVLLSRVVIDEMRTAIVPSDYGEANCANVILIRPTQKLSSQFLSLLIQSRESQKYFMGVKKGAAQQVVNTGILKEWTIPLPTIEEQNTFEQTIKESFNNIENLIGDTHKKIEELTKLKSAILAQELQSEAA